MHDDHDARLSRLERDLVHLRRRAALWRGAAAVAVLALLFGPARGMADRPKKPMRIVSSDGSQELHLEPDHLAFYVGGKPRMRMEAGSTWSTLTVFDPEGEVAMLAGSEQGTSSLKLFAPDGALRVELAEKLLDSGAGVRLYDRKGQPRATLFADKRSGESGMEITDANRQPRIDIHAKPAGISVFRSSTSDADALVELSLLPESDALSRYTGGIPEPRENEPMVPMIYLLDTSGRNHLVTPGTP